VIVKETALEPTRLGFGNPFIALYQGTTLVVPPPAKRSGLQPLPPQNTHEFPLDKAQGLEAPTLSLALRHDFSRALIQSNKLVAERNLDKFDFRPSLRDWGPIQQKRSLGCAHRFRPTYALANVGRPSIPSWGSCSWMIDGDDWQRDEACVAWLMPDSLCGLLIIVWFRFEDVGHKSLRVAIVKRKERGLHLDHNPVARLEGVVDHG